MKNLKNYAVVLGVVSVVVVVVQLIATIFNFSLDINIIVEVAACIIAILVTFGVIVKKDTTDKNFDQIKKDIKQDIIDNTTISNSDDPDTKQNSDDTN